MSKEVLGLSKNGLPYLSAVFRVNSVPGVNLFVFESGSAKAITASAVLVRISVRAA